MNLWSSNHPRNFWQCQPDPPEQAWQTAIARALPSLGLTVDQPDIDMILALTLGEGRYGPDHWDLGLLKRLYYLIKPILPRSLTRRLRCLYNRGDTTAHALVIERRYVDFMYEILRQIILRVGHEELRIRNFWPDQHYFAFCLTHDIESAEGQNYVQAVTELEESLGYRSCFNFVPEKYTLDLKLMDTLRQRGFEVGVHGLKHNGRLFNSKPSFQHNASKINGYLNEWGAKGFRAELTLRQPEWMQLIEVDYDLSFFDSDPFEPIPGGTMSIWPFFIGRFVELPYTLIQDYTLISILGETSPRLWLEKVDFIEKYHGMVLLNSHPDYLCQPTNWNVYHDFLAMMKNRNGYWHALPRDVSEWWRYRSASVPNLQDANENQLTASLQLNKLILE